MTELKHYNLFALQGDAQTTDQDVCETLGLDPRLANTPKINDAAIDKMYRDNYQGYLAQGMTESDALVMAHSKAQDARQAVKSAMNRED
jgi:hypothetical protein